MTANETQIGGTHYRTTYQHWDYAAKAFGPGYFKGNITKYVSRARKKHGVQDYEKARHYLVKMMEINWQTLGYPDIPSGHVSPGAFSIANDLDQDESRVIFSIAVGDYGNALTTLNRLIAAMHRSGEPQPKGYVDQDLDGWSPSS